MKREVRKADDFSLMVKKSQFPDFILKEMSISAFLPTSRNFLERLAGWGWVIFCLFSGKMAMWLLRELRFSLTPK